MNHAFTCFKCGASFTMPEAVPAETKAAVATLVREHQPVAAMKCWQDATRGDVANAKAIALHITTQKGQCHRCNRELSGDGISECTQCRSVNLDWGS